MIERLLEKFEILLSGFASSMRLPIQVQAILFRKSNEKIQYLIMKRTPEREGFFLSYSINKSHNIHHKVPHALCPIFTNSR